MTPTISVLIFIGVVFAAVAALRLLVSAALVVAYFVADLAGAPRPTAHARLFDLDLPTAH